MAIIGDDRLIVVCGMAHSGTTILTYLLQQHPGVVCCVGGPESWILENDWLKLERAGPIQEVLEKFPDKSILLKRPWVCMQRPLWLLENMPNARYIYCYRSFEDISASWSKQGSFVDAKLRQTNKQKEFYDKAFQAGEIFGAQVSNFRRHYHPSLLENPEKEIMEIAVWLGLSSWKFDVSPVGGVNVKSLLMKHPKKLKLRRIHF